MTQVLFSIGFLGGVNAAGFVAALDGASAVDLALAQAASQADGADGVTREPTRPMEFKCRVGAFFASRDVVMEQARVQLMKAASAASGTFSAAPEQRIRYFPFAKKETDDILKKASDPHSPYARWLAIYQRAPRDIQTLIYRGGVKPVRLKPGALDRLLARLDLNGRHLAFLLLKTDALISCWRHGEVRMPKPVYEILQRSQTKDDAMWGLIAGIAQWTEAYTSRYPYWEQVFELHRILRTRGLALSKFDDWLRTRNLRGQRDIQAVLEIAKQDIPADEINGKIQEALRDKLRAIAFYRNEPANRALREAKTKFGLTTQALADLFGISYHHYNGLSLGTDPVSPHWERHIQALREASTPEELKARLAQLPPVKKALPNQSQKMSQRERKVKLEAYYARYRGLVFHKAWKALSRFDLGSNSNAEEIVQDVFMALDRTLQWNGNFQNEGYMRNWFNRVVRNKVFDRVLAARGINKKEANFYFRMRRLAIGTVDGLMAFDPRLTRGNAEAHLRRYEGLRERFYGLEISIEDLPKGTQRKMGIEGVNS